MMITCSKCGRKQPLTEEDLAAFHPYFFCLTCGEKMTLATPDAALRTIQRSNDRSRTLAAADLQGLPPADQVRKVVRRDGAAADGGG
jgi:hypothetical protein